MVPERKRQLHLHEDVKLMEYPTLDRLYDYCKANPSHLALYLHSKGVNNAPGTTRHRLAVEWRRIMEHFLLAHWRQCTAALGRGYDACGVNYHLQPFPHFSGNFFWTTCAHVARRGAGPLGPASAFFSDNFPDWLPPDRAYAEAWLLDKNPGEREDRVWHCFDDGTDHYFHPFDMSRLRNLDCSSSRPVLDNSELTG
jgi:hypothetical protein